ncbi:hypothetical protein TNCV_1524571 [Trichonephila clavipes]|nr:hypothetical protein TNCV_1524571 [Trichonephila clavipes]
MQAKRDLMCIVTNEAATTYIRVYFWASGLLNSPQSHIVRVYDVGHDKSGVYHSAEWHDGDWLGDGIREAWLWFFIWVESF